MHIVFRSLSCENRGLLQRIMKVQDSSNPSILSVLPMFSLSKNLVLFFAADLSVFGLALALFYMVPYRLRRMC